jgi:hypothetical protein
MRKERRLSKWEDKAWKSSMRILLAGLAGLGAEVNAVPTGIIAGQDTALNAYAALVMQSGALVPVAGLPALSVINAVAMNSTGLSLIGGKDTNLGAGYAAIISPTGTLTPLPLVLTGLNPMINSVAINSDTGLIGGQASGNGPGFAAFVLPDGTISPAAGFADVTANTNLIFSTAINCSSVGLIGGEGLSPDYTLYAAYVTLDGTLTPLSLPPSYSGLGGINSVAINAQGIGIIGGNSGDSGAVAEIVTPSGGVLAVFTTSNPNDSFNSVAINNAGLGLIGGDVGLQYYAAYATQQGVLTPVATPAINGSINSVALNSSGAGIIGGSTTIGPTPYAALVQPNGSLTSLNLGVFTGTINSVAISESGIGLIGGTNQTLSEAYAALVAPNGTVTPLDVIGEAVINGVDLSGKLSCSSSSCIFEEMTPKSIGPYLSVAYTQLAASYALDTRFTQKNCSCTQMSDTPATPKARSKSKSNCKNCNNETASAPAKQNSIWFAPFGNYNHVREQGKIPRYNNQIGGALVGYDYQGSNYLAGASLGYAFNYVGYRKGIGHGKINNEMASIYGSYNKEHFRLNGALWGGYYQFRNIRHANACSIAITSKAKTHGWTLSPELQIASPWAINQKKCYVAEPFVKFDWFNEWQHRFTETGKAGFNLRVPSFYYSFLQSEAGVRFYETFTYGWGNFCLEEKISYVNQAPFHVHSVKTSFVGATSSFPIEIASSKIENLGAVQLMGSFTPRDSAYPLRRYFAAGDGKQDLPVVFC